MFGRGPPSPPASSSVSAIPARATRARSTTSARELVERLASEIGVDLKRTRNQMRVGEGDARRRSGRPRRPDDVHERLADVRSHASSGSRACAADRLVDRPGRARPRPGRRAAEGRRRDGRDTTACGRSRRRCARATSCACGSASASRRRRTKAPTTSCRGSRRTNASSSTPRSDRALDGDQASSCATGSTPRRTLLHAPATLSCDRRPNTARRGPVLEPGPYGR